MPKIPVYEQQATPSGTLSFNADAGGQSIVRGLAVAAGAADQVSRNLFHAQEVERRKAEADSVTETNLALATGEAEWEQHFQERTTAEDATPDGFTDRLLTDFQKWAGELRGKAKTPKAREMAELGIVQLGGRLAQSALKWERDKGIEQRGSKYEESVDHRRRVLRANPDLFDEQLEQAGRALSQSSLPTDVRDRLWTATKEGFAGSAVEALIDRDPYAARRMLTAQPGQSGNSAVDALSADGAERAMRGADAEINRREAEARARAAEARQRLAEDEADALAFKAAGMPGEMPSRARYVAAYGAAEGNKRYAQKSQLMGIYDAVSAAVLLPPAEGQAKIAAYKPTQQAGAADQLDFARAAAGLYEQSRKAFEADPAGTLIARDPQLRAAYEAATAPDATPAAVQTYASRVSAAQTAAGIAAPSILPAAQAEAIAAQLVFDPKRPERRAQQLQALQQAWGRAYPQVLREVAPKMDGTARVMAGMRPEKAARLDAAIAAGEAAGKSVPKTDQKGVNDELAVLLAPFAGTLTDNVDFDERYGEHYEAAKALALSAVARGESPRTAARNAVQAVVGDAYQIRGGVRIPQGVAADPVLAGAEWARRRALKEPLKIPASSYSDDAQAQADLRETIARGGYWVTNDDHTGLMLRVPTRRGTSTVLRADGSPYEFTWAELSELAAEGAQVRRESELDITRRGGVGTVK